MSSLTDAQVLEAADFLDAATASGLPLPPIPESCRPQSAADGGRIYWERWSRDPKPAVAWKAAVIGGDMALAPFFDGMVIPSPATLPAATFLNIILEAEVSFALAQEFAPVDGGHSAEAVLAGVASANIAIEAPNSRYETRADLPSMAADGVGNEALIVGPEIADWQSTDLVALPCEIVLNGEVVAAGRDERPNPIEILVATVNEINRRGMTVAAGEVITTGAAAVHLPSPSIREAGQEIVVRFADIGEVTLWLT